jgi:general secretion pathway protein G
MQMWTTRRAEIVGPANRRQRGFTLIEIMVVIAILGILAALIVPKIMSRPDEARRVAAKQDIGTIMQAMKLYRLQHGSGAEQLEGRRIPRAFAERSVGQSVSVSEPGRAR